MKTRKFGKKLTLNKKTVAHLGNKEMQDLQAGHDQSVNWTNCPSCFATVCCTDTCSCAESACISCKTDCNSLCSGMYCCL